MELTIVSADTVPEPVRNLVESNKWEPEWRSAKCTLKWKSSLPEDERRNATVYGILQDVHVRNEKYAEGNKMAIVAMEFEL